MLNVKRTPNGDHVVYRPATFGPQGSMLTPDVRIATYRGPGAKRRAIMRATGKNLATAR